MPDLDTRAYFDGLRRHEVLLTRCTRPSCQRWLHPPLPACPACHCTTIAYERAQGSGTIWSCTVVGREFTPGLNPPYVAALVELDEQRGLRVLSNIVFCDVEDVSIGLRVVAHFEDYEEHTMLYFRPDGSGA